MLFMQCFVHTIKSYSFFFLQLHTKMLSSLHNVFCTRMLRYDKEYGREIPYTNTCSARDKLVHFCDNRVGLTLRACHVDSGNRFSHHKMRQNCTDMFICLFALLIQYSSRVFSTSLPSQWIIKLSGRIKIFYPSVIPPILVETLQWKHRYFSLELWVGLQRGD